MERSDTITLGILGTANFIAPLELFFSVFEDKPLFLRQLIVIGY
jgi:hypothetical protein